MALLEWHDDYRTGIDGVDYEHETLIGRINRIHALIERTRDRDAVVDALGELYGDIAAHFALEEQWMLRHEYPDYPAHRADHERLLDEIRDITAAYRGVAEPDRAAFEARLRDWFGMHFRTHDARLHGSGAINRSDAGPRTGLRGLIRHAKHKLLRRRTRDA